MKKPPNMHVIDRYVRLIVGLACLYVVLLDTTIFLSTPLAILVAVFGAVNLWAFITVRCPVYTLAGFSTATGSQSSGSDQSAE